MSIAAGAEALTDGVASYSNTVFAPCVALLGLYYAENRETNKE